MTRTSLAVLAMLGIALVASSRAGADAPAPAQPCAAFTVPLNHLANDGMTWKEYGGTKKAGVVHHALPSGWVAVGGSTMVLSETKHSAVILACRSGG